MKVWGGEIDREAVLVKAAREFADAMNEFGTEAGHAARAFEKLELALSLYEENDD